jgi:hypothetical protein
MPKANSSMFDQASVRWRRIGRGSPKTNSGPQTGPRFGEISMAATLQTVCARGSSSRWNDIRMYEVITLEEQRLTGRFCKRVSKTVAEI